ncbi:phage repressor protein C with HTH and peptisase S24 domain [Pseudochelatococcus lubricantis]|uniref:Phage repressor protein C with HTH and peptisase S24 domain n=1 Tax=Pseudochelatococcus lubricantis TaxID=1538102 RepID=A0ABX0V2L4_9HYPH|nr:helix-turn-helix transcriptional regulator [Pseudochelatococcus lubricantis]NIJ58595.1 phage repressor protein C with HTH and peptisase S24 domain [Pseudochelatococcus lubricantis]
MLSHDQIWSALDAFAAQRGLSPSGLARKAGLDPTAFNRSKRTAADGRPRWPSTESIAKVLDATGASLDEFMALVSRHGRYTSTRNLPLIGFAQAGKGGFFDDGGFPVGGSWDEVAFPDMGEDKVFALEISGDSMLPIYRDGDVIIVSPTASVRRGDRVVVRTAQGEVMAKELKRRTARTVELRSFNPEHEDRVLAESDIAWIARVIWASQ